MIFEICADLIPPMGYNFIILFTNFFNSSELVIA